MDRNYFQKSWRYCQSAAAAAAKSLQSCPTLCDPIDGSPAGSPIPGILQARTLEWVAISFSNAWKWKVKEKSLSKCPTLSDPMDYSLPGSFIHGIFQARVKMCNLVILESSQNCLKCTMLDKEDRGENDSCFFGLQKRFLPILPMTSLFITNTQNWRKTINLVATAYLNFLCL